MSDSPRLFRQPRGLASEFLDIGVMAWGDVYGIETCRRAIAANQGDHAFINAVLGR
jgi:hypothetical protein